MRQLTSLLLLLLVASVALASTEVKTESDDSGSNVEGTKETPVHYVSPEAKKMTERLQSYLDNIDHQFNVFVEQLVRKNDLLTTVKKYRSTYEASKHTKCAGSEPPSDSDDDLMMSYMEDCEDALTSDKLEALGQRIEAAKSKVKELDEVLRKNEKTCATDPTACEETKRKTVDQIEDVLTDEKSSSYELAASEALDESKKLLTSCFNDGTKDLKDSLEDGIESINSCMAKDAKKE